VLFLSTGMALFALNIYKITTADAKGWAFSSSCLWQQQTLPSLCWWQLPCRCLRVLLI